ncbi:hypothetical protein HMPREF1210_01152 [Paenisporosarcina sp. HGH0030]|uniref:hypothetical protein n=1 Tax=Paenisporosarcina sp. HGH0030 TaxID=1078085 RepID=UPI00034EA487|nr:hypothetical protein [Paenisporosarcina sp. HGH0030]EPD52772.1 hypothetical protein HMPREF1210_01152 [Paenisporosarcina sp. HGH0030]
MNYKVAVSYGTEGTSTQDVQNVSEIVYLNDAYYFYNELGEVIFIAPQNSVVFIKNY